MGGGGGAGAAGGLLGGGHVGEAGEDGLAAALPVEVGLQRRRGVQGTQGLPPAVLVVTPRPGAVQLHTLQGLELFAIGGAKEG